MPSRQKSGWLRTKLERFQWYHAILRNSDVKFQKVPQRSQAEGQLQIISHRTTLSRKLNISKLRTCSLLLNLLPECISQRNVSDDDRHNCHMPNCFKKSFRKFYCFNKCSTPNMLKQVKWSLKNCIKVIKFDLVLTRHEKMPQAFLCFLKLCQVCWVPNQLRSIHLT